MTTVRIWATDGSEVAFEDSGAVQTGRQEFHLTADRQFVVGFYRTMPDKHTRDRLAAIVGRHRDSIFNGDSGDYWQDLFCWPSKVVESDGRLGVVAPVYQHHFFFQHGSLNNDYLGMKGKEKEGKWFASALHQSRSLDPRERGDWSSYFRICILLSRAVRRLHHAGLAHANLNYKEMLLDPAGRHLTLINLADSLILPNQYPPDVIGTPDFIAPEVMKTRDLPLTDPRKQVPCIATDRYALAVLIYMYLLYRHPLRGRKIHDVDETRDEFLAMGERALFVEHPTDRSNRYDTQWVKDNERHAKFLMPWWDLDAVPYTVLGPYLSTLVRRAFVEGIHSPSQRPTAGDWETELVRTVDLMQPCPNPSCISKWFVFNNSTRPVCPFCKTPYRGILPVLNLYSLRPGGSYRPDNHRLIVYHNQSLYPWHVNRNITPNEHLTAAQRERVGYFVFHNDQWLLVNMTLTDLKDVQANRVVPPGKSVALENGNQLVLSPVEGGRLVEVQLVDAD